MNRLKPLGTALLLAAATLSLPRQAAAQDESVPGTERVIQMLRNANGVLRDGDASEEQRMQAAARVDQVIDMIRAYANESGQRQQQRNRRLEALERELKDRSVALVERNREMSAVQDEAKQRLRELERELASRQKDMANALRDRERELAVRQDEMAQRLRDRERELANRAEQIDRLRAEQENRVVELQRRAEQNDAERERQIHELQRRAEEQLKDRERELEQRDRELARVRRTIEQEVARSLARTEREASNDEPTPFARILELNRRREEAERNAANDEPTPFERILEHQRRREEAERNTAEGSERAEREIERLRRAQSAVRRQAEQAARQAERSREQAEALLRRQQEANVEAQQRAVEQAERVMRRRAEIDRRSESEARRTARAPRDNRFVRAEPAPRPARVRSTTPRDRVRGAVDLARPVRSATAPAAGGNSQRHFHEHVHRYEGGAGPGAVQGLTEQLHSLRAELRETRELVERLRGSMRNRRTTSNGAGGQGTTVGRPAIANPDWPTTEASRFFEYTVNPGDSAGTIARRYYGTARAVPQLMRANPGVEWPRLVPGQSVRVPHPPSPATVGTNGWVELLDVPEGPEPVEAMDLPPETEAPEIRDPEIEAPAVEGQRSAVERTVAEWVEAPVASPEPVTDPRAAERVAELPAVIELRLPPTPSGVPGSAPAATPAPPSVGTTGGGPGGSEATPAPRNPRAPARASRARTRGR